MAQSYVRLLQAWCDAAHVICAHFFHSHTTNMGCGASAPKNKSERAYPAVPNNYQVRHAHWGGPLRAVRNEAAD